MSSTFSFLNRRSFSKKASDFPREMANERAWLEMFDSVFFRMYLLLVEAVRLGSIGIGDLADLASASS